jgi:hypothetical protein
LLRSHTEVADTAGFDLLPLPPLLPLGLLLRRIPRLLILAFDSAAVAGFAAEEALQVNALHAAAVPAVPFCCCCIFRPTSLFLFLLLHLPLLLLSAAADKRRRCCFLSSSSRSLLLQLFLLLTPACSC